MNILSHQQENVGGSNSFEKAGKRLSHILDQIGFPTIRRSNTFQEYLLETCAKELGELKLSTVRSWFGTNSPSVSSTKVILTALQEEYPIGVAIVTVSAWWKLGAEYPFTASLDSISQEKLHFNIMRILTNEAGGDFEGFSIEQLQHFRDSAYELARQFADPSITSCPDEYLVALTRYEISRIRNHKN